jgi:hypothetical protein
MLQAMESSVNGGFSQLQQSCGDSSEEELSVLPRHTKVVVTGNNRTKSVLVGLQGVVKKAVGLGGWHWLVISFFYLGFVEMTFTLSVDCISNSKCLGNSIQSGFCVSCLFLPFSSVSYLFGSLKEIFFLC